ncbi:MAG: YihA family ribosome biogenesis GTP-binding protein [Deltaproteobacteria bacterium]|nr:YihA family ribosome biogenesis GTP-binding protein [Deltaproteobacteria bacterium]
MNIKSATFVGSAVKPSQYPPEKRPEIAFAGRSNVGKSSLINTLLNRKKLVKTSSSPGRTQTINFFLINNRFYFVDLPGYGYAKVPVSVRKTWRPMVEKYVSTRENLCAVVVIFDIRRIPNQADCDLLSWLAYYHIPEIVVLTKADKVKKSNHDQQCKQISQELSRDPSSLIPFSAITGLGKERLWKAIEAFLTVD